MKLPIVNGIWPTMITPFTADDKIDFHALEKLVEWYIAKGVDGLFAVCQSSEMFFLSLEERVELARFVKQSSAGRVPVIASGHIGDSFEEQVAELRELAETGIDALVLITNRLAADGESDDVWKRNLEGALKGIPERIDLGLYECPYPYKRLVTPELMKWCADTERFLFLKDTSCDLDNIKAKSEAIQGSPLKIFNANSATLLESFKLGAAGYSGVMANFHPELYVWLYRNWSGKLQEAERLSDFLSMASLIEKQLYPVNAKYYLMLEGVLDHYHCRSKNDAEFTVTNKLEIEQLHRLSQQLAARYFL